MYHNIKFIFLLVFTPLWLFMACSAQTNDQYIESTKQADKNPKANAVAYFASGCFWCVEAIYESVIGVEEVISGYSGGKKENANYKAVSAGITNHAETIAVYYDSTKIDYATLVEVFFASHDPTTLNRQGPDRGRQYRSAIFFTSNEEKKLAEQRIKQLLKDKIFENITTEVVPFEAFYEAESYHQDYEKRNPKDPYVCRVSIPRLNAFRDKHPELLK
jgi:peptide-methionine (S)-S-oxide reductase